MLALRRLRMSAVYFGPEHGPRRLLCDQVGSLNLAEVNDSPHTTYAGIRDAFRRAIAVAEASS